MKNDTIVKKILIYIDKILVYCEGCNYASFSEDTKLVEACVFNLSQIGELVNHLDEEFIDKHDSIPWRQMYGLRNRIVHDYEGVNLVLVWDIIEGDLKPLKQKLQTIRL